MTCLLRKRSAMVRTVMMTRMVMMVSRCETETSSYAEVLSTSDDECRNQNGSSSVM